MTVRGLVAKDTYRAGERYMLLAETDEWLVPGTLPAMIYSTGYTGSPWFVNRSDVMDYSISKRFTETHSFLSIDSGGVDTMGNDVAIAAIDQAVAWSEAQGRTGPFLIGGTSMGFADMSNWVRTHQEKVAGIIGFCPAVNLTGVWQTDRGGFASVVNAAYGGLYDPAVHGPLHDPTLFAHELEIPIIIFTSSNDTLTTVADHNAFAANAPDCTVVNMGAVGDHNKAAVSVACARAELEAFIQAVTA